MHESAALNILLADMFALYIKTKNFRWHVSGPHFRDYHLMLDGQGEQIFATTDDIAERARKIGGTTIRSDQLSSWLPPLLHGKQFRFAHWRLSHVPLHRRYRALSWKNGLTRPSAGLGPCSR
jgi:Ferritin-like domain